MFRKLNFLIQSKAPLIMALVVITLMSSCSEETKEDIQDSTQGISDAKIIEYLAENGFHADEIEVGEYSVTYEGDQDYLKDDIVDQMLNGTQYGEDEDLPTSLNTRQRGVPMNNALTIGSCSRGYVLWVSSSILDDIGPKTNRAIHLALKELNSLNNLGVNFWYTTDKSKATVFVGSDSDTDLFNTAGTSGFLNLSSASGKARVSSAGKPGAYISFDEDLEGYPENSIKSLVMHEIGHTIGFRHTDGSLDLHVPGTPTSDSQSIMNATTNALGEFTDGDKLGLRLYYASRLSTPNVTLSTRAKTNDLVINVTNPDPEKRPYYWIRAYRYKNGFYNGYEDFQTTNDADANGNYVWKNQPNGFYTYKFRGMRFRKDRKSPATQAFPLNF